MLCHSGHDCSVAAARKAPDLTASQSCTKFAAAPLRRQDALEIFVMQPITTKSPAFVQLMLLSMHCGSCLQLLKYGHAQQYQLLQAATENRHISQCRQMRRYNLLRTRTTPACSAGSICQHHQSKHVCYNSTLNRSHGEAETASVTRHPQQTLVQCICMQCCCRPRKVSLRMSQLPGSSPKTNCRSGHINQKFRYCHIICWHAM